MIDENEYEIQRANRKRERAIVLAQLNIIDEKKILADKPEKQNPIFQPIRKRKRSFESIDLPRRNSLRLMNKKSSNGETSDISSITSDFGETDSNGQKVIHQNFYGTIEGLCVGDFWETRAACSKAGVHRPLIAGIAPGRNGAYSVALSGNYEDDKDEGDYFVYTGSGGRDLKGTKSKPKNLRTACQSTDQSTSGLNGSLIRSVDTKNPVRVIRGHKLNSFFAPEEGYRYDGLYTVESYWSCPGASGFLVYKFLLRRCIPQPPAPWHPGYPDYREQCEKIAAQKVSEKGCNVYGDNAIGSKPCDDICYGFECDESFRGFAECDDTSEEKLMFIGFMVHDMVKQVVTNCGSEDPQRPLNKLKKMNKQN